MPVRVYFPLLVNMESQRIRPRQTAFRLYPTPGLLHLSWPRYTFKLMFSNVWFRRSKNREAQVTRHSRQHAKQEGSSDLWGTLNRCIVLKHLFHYSNKVYNRFNNRVKQSHYRIRHKRIWEVVAYSEVLVWQMPGKTEENQESTLTVTAGPLAEVWNQYTYLRSSSFCEMSVPDVSGQRSGLISEGRISIKSFFVRRSNFEIEATTLSGSVGHQSPSDGTTYLRRTETAPLRTPKNLYF